MSQALSTITSRIVPPFARSVKQFLLQSDGFFGSFTEVTGSGVGLFMIRNAQQVICGGVI